MMNSHFAIIAAIGIAACGCSKTSREAPAGNESVGAAQANINLAQPTLVKKPVAVQSAPTLAAPTGTGSTGSTDHNKTVKDAVQKMLDQVADQNRADNLDK